MEFRGSDVYSMLMRISELGCRALIEIVFESISVRRQVGYLTPSPAIDRRSHGPSSDALGAVRLRFL